MQTKKYSAPTYHARASRKPSQNWTIQNSLIIWVHAHTYICSFTWEKIALLAQIHPHPVRETFPLSPQQQSANLYKNMKTWTNYRLRIREEKKTRKFCDFWMTKLKKTIEAKHTFADDMTNLLIEKRKEYQLETFKSNLQHQKLVTAKCGLQNWKLNHKLKRKTRMYSSASYF